MDSLLFAGGQSVPSILTYALALPYSKAGREELLPPNFSLNSSTMPSYVMEIVRKFAPVSGFVVREKSAGNADDQLLFLNIQMAQVSAAITQYNRSGVHNRLYRVLTYANTRVLFPCTVRPSCSTTHFGGTLTIHLFLRFLPSSLLARPAGVGRGLGSFCAAVHRRVS